MASVAACQGSGSNNGYSVMTETHRGEKPDNYAAKLAAAKLIGNFAVRSDGELDIEKDSVYGAAILIPQL
eukprot:CAMPEP_0197896454 /NCGR_PEP_ID=MMETSP1439-20131203/39950_1 /TAXON_ID=66791 /ORGANISM="Gonyaulax spinifera, Strain CCMP409" /LENGTH=69 /DNA_ID=CAMNT_0043516985 /DNA_START=50 /DNA_END=255 /DNA_ORIENTATION=-